jgi:hypothetical protein
MCGACFPSQAAEAASGPPAVADSSAMLLDSMRPRSLVPSSRVGTATHNSGIRPI